MSLVWPVLQSYVHENMIESFIKRNAKQQDPSKFKSSTSFMPRSVSLFFMRRLGRVGVTNITVDTDSDKDTTNNTELSSVMSLASPDDTITATSPGTIEKGKAITVTTIHLTDLIRDPVECDRLQTLSIQCFSAELVLFCVDLEKYRDKVAARPLAEHFSAAASMIVIILVTVIIVTYFFLFYYRIATLSRADREKSTSTTTPAKCSRPSSRSSARATRTARLSRTTTTSCSQTSSTMPSLRSRG